MYLSSRFGPISRFYALGLLAIAAGLVGSLALVTIGLRTHPSTHNLVLFVFAVICDFYGLFVVARIWPKLVLPSIQRAELPDSRRP